MMLSPPFQDHILVFLEPGGPKAGAHVTKTCFSTGSPSQMILAEGRQAWREGCLIPCLFYQHKVSVSFKEYPLLQEAILVTLAHYNLPSNFLGHWLSGCTTSPHLTVTFPLPSLCPASAVSPTMHTPPLSNSTCSRHSSPLHSP